MNLKKSQLAKLIGLIMLIVTIVGAVISLIVIVMAEGIGFYTSNPDEYNESFISTRFINKNYSEEITNYLNATLNGADVADYEEEFSYGNTNIRFIVTDSESQKVLSNMTNDDITYYMGDDAKASKLYTVYRSSGGTYEYYVKIFIADNLEVYDDIFTGFKIYDFIRAFKEAAVVCGIIFTIASVILLYMLICAAGHRNHSELEKEELGNKDVAGKVRYISDNEVIKRNLLDRIPLDLYLAIVVCWVSLATLIADDYPGDSMSFFFTTGILTLVVIFGYIVPALSIVMTVATRMKLKAIWKNTIIYRILNLLFYPIGLIIRDLTSLWKAVLGFGIYVVITAISMLFIIRGDGLARLFFLIVFLVVQGVILTGICLYIKQLNILNKKAKDIADGNFEGDVNIEGMKGSLKNQAIYLNSINGSVARAVDEKLKSERLKTELITNVSHDIKTPLTSIINYVDLLKKEQTKNEQPDGEKVKEYIDILERHSARLKKLIEDLVEASKASTGNLSTNIEPINVVEIVNQTMGEYSERLAAAGLTPVVKASENTIYAMADGRLLWRVFDNLFGNACKYAQPNTRFYIEIERLPDVVLITLKNVSRNSLNISVDELLERFVRGDSARTTEGSGLGLSIAQSLINLQSGRLYLDIDGDLFKAKIELNSADAQFKDTAGEE